ncbi:hypothetical protein [Pontibacillus yanchengensis]
MKTIQKVSNNTQAINHKCSEIKIKYYLKNSAMENVRL